MADRTRRSSLTQTFAVPDEDDIYYDPSIAPLEDPSGRTNRDALHDVCRIISHFHSDRLYDVCRLFDLSFRFGLHDIECLLDGGEIRCS